MLTKAPIFKNSNFPQFSLGVSKLWTNPQFDSFVLAPQMKHWKFHKVTKTFSVCDSQLKDDFTNKSINLFVIVFILEVVFIFENVFLFDVVFISEVILIFEVIFILPSSVSVLVPVKSNLNWDLHYNHCETTHPPTHPGQGYFIPF